MMKRALLHAADLASLSLAAPSCITALLCSWRSGGTGVGRHAVFGCLSSATAATTTLSSAAASRHGVTVTACEAALLATFCFLQVVRLVTSAACLLTGAGSRLQLHCMATGLLLVATGSVAANNLDSFLYSAGLAMQLAALLFQLGGLGLAVAVFVDDVNGGIGVDDDGDCDGDGDSNGERAGGQPIGLNSFRCQSLEDQLQQQQQQQQLPFADEEERLVYEFNDDRLEWRLGTDRGFKDLRHATV